MKILFLLILVSCRMALLGRGTAGLWANANCIRCQTPHRSRVNSAHLKSPRPASGLGSGTNLQNPSTCTCLRARDGCPMGECQQHPVPLSLTFGFPLDSLLSMLYTYMMCHGRSSPSSTVLLTTHITPHSNIKTAASGTFFSFFIPLEPRVE